MSIEHGHHYLTKVAPRGLVDFVLVAKMTSINERDTATTPPGQFPSTPPPHRDLFLSLGDLALHYGARRHLCRPGETYYATDLGKCALPPKQAKGRTEEAEFEWWYEALLEELKLVAVPEATVVPVGSATGSFLQRQRAFPYRLTAPILHWSRAAIVASKMASSFFPREWAEFRDNTTWKTLLASTEETLEEAGLEGHLANVGERIKSGFHDRDLHLMFTYKMQMPTLRP